MPSRFVENARLIARLTGPLRQALDYEGMLEQTYRRLIRPGDHVLDVGAHSGRHTAVFAELVGAGGRVHAAEPLPQALRLLRGRALPPQVTIHATAIGPRAGMTSFVHARGTPEESGLRPKAYNRPDLVRPETIEVPIAPLDALAASFPRLDFIKLDVEGGEIGCLESGGATIRRHRPWITVEYGYPGYSAFGLTRRALFDAAAALGYRIGDLSGCLCDGPDAWERACDVAWWDWYLVPEERAEAWEAAIGGP